MKQENCYMPDIILGKAFIDDLCNNPDKYYYTFKRQKMKFGKPQNDCKGNLKKRDINTPISLLKNQQKIIVRALQAIELPECMFGSLIGKNNILNAIQHIDNKFFLTIDLKDFFSRITYKQVFEALLYFGFSSNEARIITKLTTLEGSLPQGAPTSPIIANLVFAKTALQLQAFCLERRITFTNFVDDLTFSSKRNFKHFITEIINIIKSNRFFIHHNKVHYSNFTCEVTGLFIKKKQLKLKNEMKERLHIPGVKAYALLIDKYLNELNLIRLKPKPSRQQNHSSL